jgi:phosphopantetheinyl transferase (holo-ACP synthase)
VKPRRIFAGNDIVDLRGKRREHFSGKPSARETDRAWRERHLTSDEIASLSDLERTPDLYSAFWQLFAAKEAAYKALAQAGIETPSGAYRALQVDLAKRRVTHAMTSHEVEIAHLSADREKVHCVAVFRQRDAGGSPEDLHWTAERLPAGIEPSEGARETLLRLAEGASGRGRPGRFAVASVQGIPRLLDRGEWRDWSVSLSHSGRYVASSLLF